MEYIFGTVNRNGVMVENLKIINDTHTNLQDFQQVVREYEDCTITDNFRIVEKYREVDGIDGRAYDWYVIDNHNRYVDKSGPIEKQLQDITVVLENALCEQDIGIEEHFASIEDALCELDKS